MSKNIKIFVSHRIDLESEVIDNELFTNIRCGAVFDRSQTSMLGDDTGDNISEKRIQFCELTVLYWMWKNVKADYYGLCHYRRYLSFSKEKFKENIIGCVESPYINKSSIDKFCINEKTMRDKIESTDIITSTPVDIRKVGNFKSVYNFCEKLEYAYNIEDVKTLKQIIHEKYPEYVQDCEEHFNSPYNNWYNCNIMKHDIFHDYCTWLFDILFELEKRIDTTNYSKEKMRTVGVMSERLFGIYLLHIKKQDKYKISEQQLVFFEDSTSNKSLDPMFEVNNIPIVLLSSEYYVAYCCVLLQSIIEHSNSAYNYDIIILESAISPTSKRVIEQLVKGLSNFSVRFYNPKKRLFGIKFHLNGASSIEAYYRILAPYILGGYTKAICLDCDLILETDISKLFEIDLKDNFIGAVEDSIFYGFINGFSPDFMKYCKNDFKMNNHFNYVNTGVMLMNLKKIRETFTEKHIINFAQSQKFKIQEQDAMNLLFEDNIKYLDPRWNVFTYCGGIYEHCLSRYTPYENYQSYLEARKSPNIIHFAGGIKPWQKPDDDMAERFWHYARSSVLYEVIMYRVSYDVSHSFANSSTKKIRIWTIADKLLPKGSKRRAFMRKVYDIFHLQKFIK